MFDAQFDFAALLAGLTAAAGLVVAVDRLAFAKARRARDGKEPRAVEYARSFFPVLLAVLCVRSFLAEPFRIPSSSMMPTLLIGDFVLVNKFSYGLRLPVLDRKFVEIGAPERGDVMVFRHPGRTPDDPERGTHLIKRVIGLPGDEIAYFDRHLSVNGVPVPLEDVATYQGKGANANANGMAIKREVLPGSEVTHEVLHHPLRFDGAREGRWTVPAGHYFVLGDFRDNSEDSRYWGMVPDENLVGKAFRVWMHWDAQAGGIDFHRLGQEIK